MILSRLIRKGGLTTIMTATSATLATKETDKQLAVAEVADVAVAGLHVVAHDLTHIQESNIRAWLAHIDETNSATISEVIDQCRSDMVAREYFLNRAMEVPNIKIDANDSTNTFSQGQSQPTKAN